MKTCFIKSNDLDLFITRIIDKYSVVGPVAKGPRFIFDKLDKADQLRLDYDTTILPPKKFLFPPKQDLVKFDGDKYETCLDPKEIVLLGIHPHDIKAIAMTDKLFTENYPDHNYLANRKAAVIIGSNVQNPYKNAFFGSINKDMAVSGHDVFLTRINDGYVAETITEKGAKIMSLASCAAATEDQITEATKVNQKVLEDCPEKLEHDAPTIAKKVRDSFKNEIWEDLSKDCFSCGSCNIVCPTCYCFDVQDEWGLGAANGKRYRRWDACLTAEFAEVTAQAGKENFRENKSQRYRHRFMRKTAYLNEKLGGPACVGCGRCSGACTADIANPVKTIKKIMAGG